jgi:hypothetical protein
MWERIKKFIQMHSLIYDYITKCGVQKEVLIYINLTIIATG